MKRFLAILGQASKDFASLAVTWLLLLACVRIYEVILVSSVAGRSHHLLFVLWYGCINDALWVSLLMPGLYLLYCGLYFIGKRVANVAFVLLTMLTGAIQVALIGYFATTLVPLGGDLWQYSAREIRQTLGSAGGFSFSEVAALLGFLVVSLLVFLRLPGRIRMRPITAVLVLVPGFLLAWVVGPQINPGFSDSDFDNNVALNKLQFFAGGSIQHFFPAKLETDIYADSYIGDYGSDTGGEQKVKPFNYVDESNYPFLHTDESADVLSPFLSLDKKMPNIVILVVEGLGRAFTCEGGYLGNFTPFLDSLSRQSLYWQNFLSEGGRTFAALPSILGSLPFGKNGFCEMGQNQPDHLSLTSLLRYNGYHTGFYYGGDAHFDLMDVYLKHDAVQEIKDMSSFPGGYEKLPASTAGYSWGYGDKELFRRYFETMSTPNQPYLNVLLTVSTHNPFHINEEDRYLAKFEDRMSQLKFDEPRKKDARNYRLQYASILYTDDAIRDFFRAYRTRPDYQNTIFLITGDHRMPEIPMANKIDRYHVPLILYSPRLARTATFSSISTHFDITPSLLAMYRHNYDVKLPSLVSWMGSGLDTTRAFRNVHAYPLMQTKNDLVDFICGQDMLNLGNTFAIGRDMDLTPGNDAQVSEKLKSLFDQFKQRNDKIVPGARIIPDSLFTRYYPK